LKALQQIIDNCKTSFVVLSILTIRGEPKLREHVILTDVGPRDGLQNQRKILSLNERVELILSLGDAGVRQIEIGSFVSPKAVPAMAGTDLLVNELEKRTSFKTPMVALVPNLKGYQLARSAGIRHVVMVIYGSDSMAKKNVAMTRAEAEAATGDIITEARNDGIQVTATIAVAFECPYDGVTAPETIENIVDKFVALGADYVVLADTIGAANPLQVRSLTRTLVGAHDSDRIGCHFHDTRAMGLANVYAALESGIRRFDSSIAGLGGCPFAPGASGNVATDDVAMMCEQMGFDTGIDLKKMMAASNLAATLTNSNAAGRAKPWLEKHLIVKAS
jgi:hydroxymethylglutaryl-CoA lyase